MFATNCSFFDTDDTTKPGYHQTNPEGIYNFFDEDEDDLFPFAKVRFIDIS